MRIKLIESKKWEVIGVDLDHNHAVTPSQARRCRSHRRIDSGTKRKLELNCDSGIRLNKSFHCLVVEAGGHENLQFGERDVRNYVGVYKRLKLAEGDAEAMHIYFTRMQQRNSNFFYLMDLDNEGHLRNVFWADARSRAAYSYSGNVVTFDTTYLTNRYDMSFAPFVGVNHHGQSVLLGCGLLADETIESFIWMFKAWLIAMSGRPPNAIITYQCKAMQRAIAEVFPKARHRLCLWHIMKKISDKLGRLREYKEVKKAMKSVVYESLRITDFEMAWESMIKQYSLEHNEWLTTLYEVQRQWVPTSLKEFVDQYDSALRDKYEKEAQADFESLYTNPILKTRLVKVNGPIITFAVKERAIGKNGKMLEPKVYEVLFNTIEVEVRCICNLFEHKGILCKHSLCVLNEHVDEILSQYILLRWRKDFKRRYVSNQCSKNVQAISPVQRYDVLYPQALQILDEGVISETNVISDAALQKFTGCMKIRDPVKAKRPGRPKKNRLQSSSERNIRKNGKKEQIAPTYSSLDVPERMIDIQPNMQWGNQQRDEFFTLDLGVTNQWNVQEGSRLFNWYQRGDQLDLIVLLGELRLERVMILSASSLSSQLSAIETLTGNNYVRWKRDVEIALGLLGLDFALEDHLSTPTDESTTEYVVEYQQWDRANKLCLKIIKRFILDSIMGAILDNDNAKNFLDAIGQRFVESDKAETGDLMDRLMSMKYDGSSGVREYIMKMIHISSKLEALKIPIAEPFLVYHVLNSLPSQFNQLKVAYNAQRDKWDLNDLIVVCAQEEYRMCRETVETMQLVFQPQQNKGSSHNHKSKFHKGNKSHRNQHNKSFGGQTSGGPKETVKKNDQFPVIQERVVSQPIEIVSEEPGQQEEILTAIEAVSEPQVRRSQRERSDLGLLHETKKMLSANFEMKDLGEASFVLGIEICRDRARGLLGLSQRAYIRRGLQSAVVFFSKNNKSSSGSKYIDIKYLVVRDKMKEGRTKIEHINTTEVMIADPLT
ncbi:hypothetical protein HHK36_014720 [Tetracentron sinense]|uniref:SWIM-type domain-containing protein n=1 Tax=Tetracentron sinense TaxID=13715 RepID=A0A834Z7W5_TETSI|nr:hypothetical protein HHK36_014720 [Tetracentron sinense]